MNGKVSDRNGSTGQHLKLERRPKQYRVVVSIRHSRNDKGAGVSRNCFLDGYWDAPVSYWPIIFLHVSYNSPRSLCKSELVSEVANGFHSRACVPDGESLFSAKFSIQSKFPRGDCHSAWKVVMDIFHKFHIALGSLFSPDRGFKPFVPGLPFIIGHARCTIPH